MNCSLLTSLHRLTGRTLRHGAFALAALAGVVSLAPSAHAGCVDQAIEFADDGGPDDEKTQQADITGGSVDYSAAASGQLTVVFNYDETTISGQNTLDAGILLDTNANSLANYAFFVTLGSNGGGGLQINAFQLFSGSDGNAEKITTPVLETGTLATTATIGTGTNPFNGDADTQVTLVIQLSDILALEPGLALDDVVFLNTITYPSAVPNSDPKDVLLSTGTSSVSADAESTPEGTAVKIT
ncbi:MAG: hypothetical protein ACYTFT_16685, partial [Planctomycetota bacterium]